MGRLKRRRLREREGLVLAEGPRAVLEALRSETPLRWMVVGEEYATTDDGARLVGASRRRGLEPDVVGDDLVRELCDTESPRPVLLIAEVRPPPEPDLARGRFLMLDGVQDPGNVGTLIRTAWALGLDGALIGPGSADPWSPKVVRTSAGGVFWLPVFPFDPSDADGLPSGVPAQVLVSDAGGAPVEDVVPDLGPHWILVVGNESAGVSDAVNSLRTHLVSVPMSAGVDSLNVAVAGSILLYVLGRRLRKEPAAPTTP